MSKFGQGVDLLDHGTRPRSRERARQREAQTKTSFGRGWHSPLSRIRRAGIEDGWQQLPLRRQARCFCSEGRTQASFSRERTCAIKTQLTQPKEELRNAWLGLVRGDQARPITAVVSDSVVCGLKSNLNKFGRRRKSFTSGRKNSLRDRVREAGARSLGALPAP